jgi:hypothetical protein
MDNLARAREIAETIRLSEDIPPQNIIANSFLGRESHKDHMLRYGVLISKAVTPTLENRIISVCNALYIPRTCVSAFIYNSPEVQADCLIDKPNSCVLRFTSGLINLMDEKEFEFIAGHELGHFLLRHGSCSQYLSEGTSEDFIVKRARELSADRIGYLAIADKDISIKAIIKTASGLSNEFLRFDVASFLSQTDMISNTSSGESINNTHPSMLIRCRSLLWFAMSINAINGLNNISQKKVQEVDKRVIKDLEKYVDGQTRLQKTIYKKNIILWKSALLIFHSGSFSEKVQIRLKSELGVDYLNGLKSFYGLYSKQQLETEISKRLSEELAKSYKNFPSAAKKIENEGFKIAYKIIGEEQ